jgi:hypothetical protein
VRFEEPDCRMPNRIRQQTLLDTTALPRLPVTLHHPHPLLASAVGFLYIAFALSSSHQQTIPPANALSNLLLRGTHAAVQSIRCGLGSLFSAEAGIRSARIWISRLRSSCCSLSSISAISTTVWVAR